MSFQFDHFEITSPWEGAVLKPRSMSSSSRKVHYAKTCSLVLIPSREEYQAAGIELWFNPEERLLCQQELVEQVRQLMHSNPSLTMELALAFLCQPHLEYSSALARVMPKNVMGVDVIVFDRDDKGFGEKKTALGSVLASFYHWLPSFVRGHSLKDLPALLSAAKPFKIVLLDYSTFEEEQEGSALRALRELRIYWGIVGLCVPKGCDPALRLRALEAGADFVWTNPIQSEARILPLLLAQGMVRQAIKR
mmetsp:Transcript_31143/g.68676  ORF Transcript_31143/g.68676 Transcript_31143/m.68676 type:complete len:250 (+) Transcript_31143:237-986(+)|eukprot:CAMPEP_0173309830 /NCGR_PEP_ID=MMETSP1143-20121109/22550_1 /TAXON_ID=483371 /ORGANISM="non described non described, Strain CCMP2298" /LENGTH=249 /DNA_ID=CAMNT_0014251469 /DNA_START=231 /DNA_END=980 /DNA_ORIENTATION=-